MFEIMKDGDGGISENRQPCTVILPTATITWLNLKFAARIL